MARLEDLVAQAGRADAVLLIRLLDLEWHLLTQPPQEGAASRAQLDGRRLALREALKNATTPVPDPRAVRAHVEARLATTQREHEALAARYGPRHPELVAAAWKTLVWTRLHSALPLDETGMPVDETRMPLDEALRALAWARAEALSHPERAAGHPARMAATQGRARAEEALSRSAPVDCEGLRTRLEVHVAGLRGAAPASDEAVLADQLAILGASLDRHVTCLPSRR